MGRTKVFRPFNPLRAARKAWTAYGRRLPGYSSAYGVITGGYRIAPSAPLVVDDRDFPRFEGAELASVLRTLNELLDAGKLLGPFEPGSVRALHFVPSFTVPKKGKLDEAGRQLFRLILNGSQETILSEEQTARVEEWIARQDKARLIHTMAQDGGLKMLIASCKADLGLKTTLNDHLPHCEMKLDSARQMINRLRDCRFIGKLDLQKGFRQVILHEDSYDHLVIKFYARASSGDP